MGELRKSGRKGAGNHSVGSFGKNGEGNVIQRECALCCKVEFESLQKEGSPPQPHSRQPWITTTYCVQCGSIPLCKQLRWFKRTKYCFDVWHESETIPHACKLPPEISPAKGKRKSSEIQGNYENMNTVVMADRGTARVHNVLGEEVRNSSAVSNVSNARSVRVLTTKTSLNRTLSKISKIRKVHTISKRRKTV